MKFFCLSNLSSQDIVEGDPRNVGKWPEFEDKKAFREWCVKNDTKHCFFNHIEPLTPGLRVTKANPPFYMHGFTADYDVAISQEQVLSLVAANAPSGLLPMFISTTFSGGVRLTWEFSEPVLIDQPELAAKFIHLLVSELAVNNLSVKYDRNSESPQQYFEAGTNWNPIPNGHAIPSKILGNLFYRAANDIKIKADGPLIPIEKVAEEIKSRWPNRVVDFQVGARVPLFWVEPYEDRVGAMIGDLGMLCYSSRAGKSFVPWSEILGAEFMREFTAERVGAAVENIFYDGQHYWIKGEGRRFMRRTTEDTFRYLKGQGICPKPDAKSYASEADRVLLAVQEHHEVKAAAPIPHDKRVLVKINGETYLNTSTLEVMQPAESGEPEQFPWIYEFVNKVWATPTEVQRDHWMAWLQYAYLTCLTGTPTQGQALFIAGPSSSGKTFTSHHLLGKIFGGWSDASEYLLGRTNFNKQDSEVFLWAIDDTRGSATWENKAQFSHKLKAHVANPQIRCERKGKDSVTLPRQGRIVVTMNSDDASMSILPHMDINIKDKISLFKWNCWRATFLPGGGTEVVVAKELPYFLAYLRDWRPPAYVMDANPRFVVNAYHHPDMVQAAYEQSTENRLQELIDEYTAPENDIPRDHKIWMTPTRFRKALALEKGLNLDLREFGRERMAQGLKALGLQTRQNGNSTEYLIFDPERI
jgi:hypothetical protein